MSAKQQDDYFQPLLLKVEENQVGVMLGRASARSSADLWRLVIAKERKRLKQVTGQRSAIKGQVSFPLTEDGEGAMSCIEQK